MYLHIHLRYATSLRRLFEGSCDPASWKRVQQVGSRAQTRDRALQRMFLSFDRQLPALFCPFHLVPLYRSSPFKRTTAQLSYSTFLLIQKRKRKRNNCGLKISVCFKFLIIFLISLLLLSKIFNFFYQVCEKL